MLLTNSPFPTNSGLLTLYQISVSHSPWFWTIPESRMATRLGLCSITHLTFLRPMKSQHAISARVTVPPSTQTKVHGPLVCNLNARQPSSVPRFSRIWRGRRRFSRSWLPHPLHMLDVFFPGRKHCQIQELSPRVSRPPLQPFTHWTLATPADRLLTLPLHLPSLLHMF